MERKQFLSSAAALLALSGLGAGEQTVNEEEPMPSKPPYLKKGDCIGITSPAGYINLEEILPAIKVLESWGFRVVPGSTIGKRDFTFGGTDDERAADFQRMLDDPSIHAILCARGGYGSVRIIDRLHWSNFRKKPKWIIGFSDVTIIHSHLQRVTGIASIHSKMCNSFPDDWLLADELQKSTIESIRQALTGKKMEYKISSHPSNRYGKAEGVLVGGNLRLIETMAGTASDLPVNGRILFIEDTGEYLYSIDRMLWHLQRTGKLAKLKGLIVGGFRIKYDEGDDDFGRDLYQLVLERTGRYHYPVCFEFPVGHQKNNFALKCGVRHRLSVMEDGVRLEEM